MPTRRTTKNELKCSSKTLNHIFFPHNCTKTYQICYNTTNFHAILLCRLWCALSSHGVYVSSSGMITITKSIPDFEGIQNKQYNKCNYSINIQLLHILEMADQWDMILHWSPKRLSPNFIWVINSFKYIFEPEIGLYFSKLFSLAFVSSNIYG